MICEGCIKQDTCKYREWVEEYERDVNNVREELRMNIEPLEFTVGCKYKQTYPPLPGCDANPAPADWDTVTHSCDTTTCENVPFTYTA